MDGQEQSKFDAQLQEMSFEDDQQAILRPVVEFDAEKYAKAMSQLKMARHLSREQKDEYARTLWKIMFEFAAMGFELNPVQQARSYVEK